jgi:hypothetical protein
MTGTKNLQPGMGRKKGAKNRVGTDVREAVVQAFEAGGGYKWLVTQMRENPKAFMQLLGKVMPMQVTGAGDRPLLEGGFVVNIVGVEAKDGKPIDITPEQEPIEIEYVEKS